MSTLYMPSRLYQPPELDVDLWNDDETDIESRIMTSLSLSTTAQICSNCGKSGRLYQCSRCKAESYCSTTCQTSSWPIHRERCHPPNYVLQIDLMPDQITDPPISRTLSCPSRATFADLHSAIQIAFGWSKAHTFDFKIKDPNAKPIHTPSLDEYMSRVIAVGGEPQENEVGEERGEPSSSTSSSKSSPPRSSSSKSKSKSKSKDKERSKEKGKEKSKEKKLHKSSSTSSSQHHRSQPVEPQDHSSRSSSSRGQSRGQGQIPAGPRLNLLRIIDTASSGHEMMQHTSRSHPETPELKASKTTLHKIFSDAEYTGAPVEYEYDFGDRWVHRVGVVGREVVISSGASGEAASSHPRFSCKSGTGHSCAEDVGGVEGWNRLVDAYQQPKEQCNADQLDRRDWYERLASNGDPGGLEDGRDEWWDWKKVEWSLARL